MGLHACQQQWHCMQVEGIWSGGFKIHVQVLVPGTSKKVVSTSLHVCTQVQPFLHNWTKKTWKEILKLCKFHLWNWNCVKTSYEQDPAPGTRLSLKISWPVCTTTIKITVFSLAFNCVKNGAIFHYIWKTGLRVKL